jgi:hypothetical protein
VTDQRRDPPTQHRKLGPSLGLLLRCGCGQQLGYAPFTSLAEAGQVLQEERRPEEAINVESTPQASEPDTDGHAR